MVVLGCMRVQDTAEWVRDPAVPLCHQQQLSLLLCPASL